MSEIQALPEPAWTHALLAKDCLVSRILCPHIKAADQVLASALLAFAFHMHMSTESKGHMHSHAHTVHLRMRYVRLLRTPKTCRCMTVHTIV